MICVGQGYQGLGSAVVPAAAKRVFCGRDQSADANKLPASASKRTNCNGLYSFTQNNL